MTETPHITSFEEFWPYYVGAHRRPVCRAFHYFGCIASIACLGWVLVTGAWLGLLAVPAIGYGFSWIGHFFFERNRPATFDYFAYSLIGEFKMLGLALTGRMGREVERLYGSRSPAADAPPR